MRELIRTKTVFFRVTKFKRNSEIVKAIDAAVEMEIAVDDHQKADAMASMVDDRPKVAEMVNPVDDHQKADGTENMVDDHPKVKVIVAEAVADSALHRICCSRPSMRTAGCIPGTWP